MNARHATKGGRFVWAVSMLLLAASARAQTTWYVDDDAPNDPAPGDPTVSDPLEDGSAEHPFDAIQEGINAASTGDEVVVCPGTYNEAINFLGKAIVVRSSGGTDTTTITASGLHASVVTCSNGEGLDSLLEGFTVTAGQGTDAHGYNAGGGMYNYYASPTVSDCRFTENSATYGGGMYNMYSSPTVVRCTFNDNRAFNEGGGISNLFCSRPIIVGCTFYNNWGSGAGAGITCIQDADATIVDCVFAGNSGAMRGGAINCTASDPTITNCTLTANRARGAGGGIYCDYYTSPPVNNSIVWANTPDAIFTRPTADPTVTFSDVEGGWTGIGNIDADPLFVDPDGPDDDPNTWEDNDFHLGAGSPCIDAGDPEFIQEPDDRDMDGQWRVWDGDDDGEWRIDMGGDEFGSHHPGDLDGDADVDLTDLAQLLANYGGADMTPADGDFDLDGDVDLSDLSALLAVYGTNCD